MPNWCGNVITIYNPKVFKEKCIKDGQFSFNNIIPTPKHVELFNDMGITPYAQQLMKDSGVVKENLTGELDNTFFKYSVIDFLYAKDWLDKQEDKTGIRANGWFDWNCDNWGTKWDVDEDVVDLGLLNDAICKNTDFTFSFDTAWTPPIPVLEKMAELGVTFDFESEEPGYNIYCSGATENESLNYSYDEDHIWEENDE